MPHSTTPTTTTRPRMINRRLRLAPFPLAGFAASLMAHVLICGGDFRFGTEAAAQRHQKRHALRGKVGVDGRLLAARLKQRVLGVQHVELRIESVAVAR